MSEQRDIIISAMRDAETKAWEGLRGYKFWMFGYHAARWVNYNSLLPPAQRFRSPFRPLVEIADRHLDKMQLQLPALEISSDQHALGFEGDGA
jgi:hypothetical protein